MTGLNESQRRIHRYLCMGLSDEMIVVLETRDNRNGLATVPKMTAKHAVRQHIPAILKKCGAANKVHLAMLHVASLEGEEREAFLREVIERKNREVM